MYNSRNLPFDECCLTNDGYGDHTSKKMQTTTHMAKCIKVPEVIGRNTCQVLVECVVPFPQHFFAEEIKDIKKTVKDLIVHICKDKVLINGVLHKNVNYKALDTSYEAECGCEKVKISAGSVRHIGFDVPFSCFIDIPGAMCGDDFQIEFAGVEDGCELDILEDPVPMHECKYPVKLYRKLREKVVITIDLKVLRHTQITVRPENNNICP